MTTWIADERTGFGNDLEHLDGVPWHKASTPRFLHRHRAQTRGYLGYFNLVERCACGAARRNGRGRWVGHERRHT